METGLRTIQTIEQKKEYANTLVKLLGKNDDNFITYLNRTIQMGEGIDEYHREQFDTWITLAQLILKMIKPVIKQKDALNYYYAGIFAEQVRHKYEEHQTNEDEKALNIQLQKKNHLNILQILHESTYLQHKDIVQKLDIDGGQLSRIFSEMLKLNLIQKETNTRNAPYELTHKGRNIAKKITAQNNHSDKDFLSACKTLLKHEPIYEYTRTTENSNHPLLINKYSKTEQSIKNDYVYSKHAFQKKMLKKVLISKEQDYMIYED